MLDQPATRNRLTKQQQLELEHFLQAFREDHESQGTTLTDAAEMASEYLGRTVLETNILGVIRRSDNPQLLVWRWPTNTIGKPVDAQPMVLARRVSNMLDRLNAMTAKVEKIAGWEMTIDKRIDRLHKAVEECEEKIQKLEAQNKQLMEATKMVGKAKTIRFADDPSTMK